MLPGKDRKISSVCLLFKKRGHGIFAGGHSRLRACLHARLRARLCKARREDMRARIRRKRIAVTLRLARGNAAADKKAPLAEPFQRAPHRALGSADTVQARYGLGDLPVGYEGRLRLEQAQDGDLHLGKTERAAGFSQGRLRGRLRGRLSARIRAGLHTRPAAWAIPRRAARLAPQQRAGIRGRIHAGVHGCLRLCYGRGTSPAATNAMRSERR